MVLKQSHRCAVAHTSKCGGIYSTEYNEYFEIDFEAPLESNEYIKPESGFLTSQDE